MIFITYVALLTESVDWNGWNIDSDTIHKVALLTESVDWNGCLPSILSLPLRRSPHGERGLKYNYYILKLCKCKVALLTESVDWNTTSKFALNVLKLSLSSRRAWIEIKVEICKKEVYLSRSPHGERGLKWKWWNNIMDLMGGRSPHGERGLKFLLFLFCLQNLLVALLTESVDWNVSKCDDERTILSRSPHGERGLKYNYTYCVLNFIVALLTESVDWNCDGKTITKLLRTVALLTESVDWNRLMLELVMIIPHTSLSSRRAWIEMLSLSALQFLTVSLSSRRAWIEIKNMLTFRFYWHMSLSSRRAWIEISFSVSHLCKHLVALLTESVDWNLVKPMVRIVRVASLSSRRAWIEIFSKSFKLNIHSVALLTESVDWNIS